MSVSLQLFARLYFYVGKSDNDYMTTNTDPTSTGADLGKRIAAVLYAERAAAIARRMGDASWDLPCDDGCPNCTAYGVHDCPEAGR